MERISDKELKIITNEFLKSCASTGSGSYDDKIIGVLQELKERRAAGWKWISVKDRLPEIGDEVIVYTPNSRTKVTALCRLIRYEEDTDFFWDNFYGGTYFHLREAVTHWMPLPEPPKEGDE